MNVLIGCEFSGRVRDAFRHKGHNAWSCDLIDSENAQVYHIKCDILEQEVQNKFKWDLLIAFPPCTYLCSSGARWWGGRKQEQIEAINFVEKIIKLPIEKIAIENPIGKLSKVIRKPDQIIQPWMFGCGETKATCLWLKNLPKLVPTNIVNGREAICHRLAPSRNRSKIRSTTYLGIAEAMAEQWG